VRFNVSTGAALLAHRIPTRQRFVWWPDAQGSIAFLASGALAVLAVTMAVGLVQPKSREWLTAWINLIGCIAFAASAVGAFITKRGITEDAPLANLGTFVGALCFLIAALLMLPKRLSPDSQSAGL
jgi:peptidoglycan/LPS O-acetylase OafA/YrhL